MPDSTLARRTSIDLPTGAGLGAILLWSATFAFARSLSEQVGPLTGGAAAYLIAGSICLLRLSLSSAASDRLRKLPRCYLLGCGSLFVFYTAAIYIAVGLARNREQLLEIALVNYLWPAFTVLWSLLLLNKRASFWLAPGTGLALAGVLLVVTQGGGVSLRALVEHLESNPAAYGLALAAAVSWALYSNLTRRWAGPGSGGAVELFIPATGLALLGLRFLVTEPSRWTLRAGAEASGLAALTAVAYFFWDVAMRRGNLVLVIVCSYLTPLLSTLVSCLYLGVPLTARLAIGCMLLVSGSFITFCSVSD